ncbi:MAG: tetratricopeptide repeat protein [Bacteroidota bacterium]
MKIVVVLLLSVVFFSPIHTVFAQATTSEFEVSLQGEFIDASREKLLGNYEKAADAYKAIVRKDRSKHAAHYELARVYAKLDRDDEAQKAIKEAIALESENIWYQFFQAELFEKMSDDRRAAAVYADLVRRYPKNEKYYFKQAFYLVRARDIDEAIDVYDALEKKVGLTEEIVRRKHTLYMGAGDLKKAAKELERLTTAFPKQLDYQHLLATFYLQIEQGDKAKCC